MSALKRIRAAQLAGSYPPENIVIKRSDLVMLLDIFELADNLPDLVAMDMHGHRGYDSDFQNLDSAVKEFKA